MVRVLGGDDPATRVENRIGEPAANPYLTLRDAVSALKEDSFFEALGAEFVKYYVHIKNAEIDRFQAEVSE
jgi:glutamine synthetase